MTALLVALGAAVGAPLRHFVGHHLDGRMPWGILLVNVAGSFLLGMFSALALSGSPAEPCVMGGRTVRHGGPNRASWRAEPCVLAVVPPEVVNGQA